MDAISIAWGSSECIFERRIGRLCLMLLGQESIRDVILFAQLKPK
jgi:hypothetical protein